ncbi:MAG: T9SS type A sorting domain-containing protein, partial [Crocinitomicaceae bacterium]
WGHESDQFGGVCYPASAQNPWVTGQAVTVPANEGGTIAVHIKPDGDNGCPVYRYSVMDGSNELAYLDIAVCKSASVDEITPLSVSVAPNPARTYIKVNTNGVEGATVKMVDVLGNIVLKETVMGSSKTINTSNFRNGIYFVVVESEGSKPVNRKVIIRK